jgi:hypothetical protein
LSSPQPAGAYPSGAPQIIDTGTIVRKWAALGADPQVVPSPSGGLQAIFPGQNNVSGSPYNSGALVTATSDEEGRSWTLGGSVSHSVSYWAERLLPGREARAKAPGSGGAGLASSRPSQPAALAAPAYGTPDLAYCVPTTSVSCAHIALWDVGARQALTVPGSATGRAQDVAVAADPRRHLWILWYDAGLKEIRLVRTNAAGTRFSQPISIPAPPKLAAFDGLAGEASQGLLSLVALARQTAAGATPAYWSTALYPTLHLAASPSRVSNSRATAITFTVTDVGDPVANAKITFLGHTAQTNVNGVAKLTVPKGTATGKRYARAGGYDYDDALLAITVT